jgi:hypothetical protein
MGRAQEPDRRGGQPRGRARLWAAVRPTAGHPVEPAALGEYAALLLQSPAAAARAFPGVAAHLRQTGCPSCRADLTELIALLDADGS